MAQTKRKNLPAWWLYVQSIIRQYPELKKKLETPLEPKISRGPGISYTMIGKNGKTERAVTFEGLSRSTSSPVENCVIHDLPPKEQRKFDAVDNAIRQTKILHPYDYQLRLEIINLVYFKKSNTIAGAALKVGCHTNTAGAWQAEFIRLVAEELDLP